MKPEMIARINELAKKSRSTGLTAEEVREQKELRETDLREFRTGMEAQLQALVIRRPDGTEERLQKKQ